VIILQKLPSTVNYIAGRRQDRGKLEATVFDYSDKMKRI
jgi:hypothetical protein